MHSTPASSMLIAMKCVYEESVAGISSDRYRTSREEGKISLVKLAGNCRSEYKIKTQRGDYKGCSDTAI